MLPISAQLGTRDTRQCIIVDLCAFAPLGCAGGHQKSVRSPSVFAIRRGVCTSPADVGNTLRGGDKRVRARSGGRTTEGWRARTRSHGGGSSQTAVFASERVPNADARHRELSKGDEDGGPINDV